MKQLILLIVIAGIVVFCSNENEYLEIPSSSIRMRVIANSNSEEDQADKYIVKSFVEEKLYEFIDGLDREEDIMDSLEKNKEVIDAQIESEIKKANLDVDYSSNLGNNYFPQKEFKGLVYAAGNYDSFVVTLGEGEGENWWCVLYPPLCTIDENKSETEYHSLIKDTILKYN